MEMVHKDNRGNGQNRVQNKDTIEGLRSGDESKQSDSWKITYNSN